MARMSDAGVQLLLQIASPLVNVSYDAGWPGRPPTLIASPVQGHGRMSNPPGRTADKLIDDGFAEPSRPFMTLTPAGRERADQLRAEGWELVTATGQKSRAVKS